MKLINAKKIEEVIEFSKMTKKLIIITRGKNGAIAIKNEKVVECPAKENLKIVDLTGAGDLFASGFLHGYINDKSIHESLEKGTEMSAKGSNNRCEIKLGFFSFKTSFTFFGFTTLFLYLPENKSLANLFLFFICNNQFII